MILVYMALAAGIFLLDLVLKNYIEAHKEAGKEEKLAKGALLIRKYHNRGAFLNAGEKVNPLVRVLSLVLTVGVALLFLVSSGKNRRRMFGLSLLLGGACSNTYDRMKRGYVVDYFSFGVRWKWLRRIVFNISDFCILAGALLAIAEAENGQ